MTTQKHFEEGNGLELAQIPLCLPSDWRCPALWWWAYQRPVM